MKDSDIVKAINQLCEAGGIVTVGPADVLNPRCGYEATIELPAPLAIIGSTKYRSAAGVHKNAAVALISAIEAALLTRDV